MTVSSKDERIAILLRSLGDDFATGVLGQLSGDQASRMKSMMERLESAPPHVDDVTEVLDEFNRFMEFAMANSEELAIPGDTTSEENEFPQFVSTGDVFDDLEGLQDYQIAGALRNETGLTISIILRQLSDRRVGEIMGQIPEEVQEEAFLRLQSSPQVSKPLVRKIVQAVVDKASLLGPNAASDPVHLADEKTASLLRVMDRKTRTTMMSALENKDPEVAERVKGMLFVFEDVLRFTDKSVQSFLAEVDTAELATALKNAEQDIVDKITGNLSKRAKATLLEEIEYLESVTSEQEEEVHKSICGIFSQLDQSGDLEMVD